MTASYDPRPALLARVAAFALAGLFAAGCDQDDGQCLPEDDCDGIASIEERPEGVEPVIGDAVWHVEPIMAEVVEDAGEDADGHGAAGALHGPEREGGPFDHPRPPLPTLADADLAPEGAMCPGEDDPRIGYAALDPQVCGQVLIECLPGWEYFNDACGCGCAYTGPSGVGDLAAGTASDPAGFTPVDECDLEPATCEL